MRRKHTGPIRPVTFPIEGDPSMVRRVGILALVSVIFLAVFVAGLVVGRTVGGW